MVLAAIVLGLCIVLAALIQRSYHVKPRMAKCQVTILGTTEQNEQFHAATTLFEDETAGQQWEKLQSMWDLREQRLGFQNKRAMDLFKESMANQENLSEEQKAALEKLGVKLQAVAPPAN